MNSRARKQKRSPKQLALAFESEQPVLIVRHDEFHRAALQRLDEFFGRDDFSLSAAEKIGVDARLVRDLIGFDHVRVVDGRCVIHPRLPDHSFVYEIPLPFDRHDSTFAISSGKRKRSRSIRSKTFPLAERLRFVEPNPDVDYERFKKFESMTYKKRFRWPRSLHDILTERYGNVSAYIRYLIYKDLGLEEEAAHELERMDPRV